MPFSWKKKTRCTRFSQLVADHLQSPKHGGSLVVETGFPTSLIDLYVRNRGRFRKSSAKKQRENDSQTSLSTSTSSSSGLFVDPNNFSSGNSDYTRSDEIIEEDIVVESMVSSDDKIEIDNPTKSEVEKKDEMAKLNPVLVAALKVLFMLVLALGTKKFTVGITLSAFLLFFLESVVKQLLGRSSSRRPSLDSKPQFESNFHETKSMKRSKENTTLVVCSEVLEIEEQVELKEEVRSEKELDEVKSEIVMEIRHKTSRRAILKSRMKKLVPKKLHKSSIGSKGEIPCVFKEEETVKCAQDLKPVLICNESSDSKGETLCVLKQEQDNIVEIEGRPSSSSLTLSSETDCNDKDLGKGSQQNSGYLVLCLIVLIGLIGGRILALVLALSWCLILKKAEWRSVKFPNS
ncbi:unnamed protein product [Lactuca saligna]|uniref:Ethylene-responsive nuclear family protein n=1 Tax=Lactuca saligna TaxID=75948 RepID=A0AA36A0M5_LACSI|nr:unnamed protein product [Lactuca saligna]